MKDSKEYAKDAYEEWKRKYPFDGGDHFDAANLVRDHLEREGAPEKIRDALEFVLNTWNTGYDEDE